MLPIPGRLVRRGVQDMLRLSDARMSETSYGACILHVSPKAHVGGTLALVQPGDLIRVDVRARSIELLVEEAELARRRAALAPRRPRFGRGYGAIVLKHVMQADKSCDFDFLEISYGPPAGEPKIH